MSTPDKPAGEFDRVRERLNTVTQETRFSLIQDILGHPEQLPTLKELNYVNPSNSQTTIRQHLQELVNVDIVEDVSLPKDQRQNDLPYKFYGLSDAGREFLQEHGLLRAEETLTEVYTNIEKPRLSNGTKPLRALNTNSSVALDGEYTAEQHRASTRRHQ